MGWGKRKEDAAPATPVDRDDGRGQQLESEQVSVLGATLSWRGELSGSQDIAIHGRFEGTIDLPEHVLTVGVEGHVQAQVRARQVVIEGRMRGDITADDKVEIAGTGSLQGDIRANRVVLHEDARFRGSIDTDWRGSADPAGEAADVVEMIASADPTKLGDLSQVWSSGDGDSRPD